MQERDRTSRNTDTHTHTHTDTHTHTALKVFSSIIGGAWMSGKITARKNGAAIAAKQRAILVTYESASRAVTVHVDAVCLIDPRRVRRREAGHTRIVNLNKLRVCARELVSSDRTWRLWPVTWKSHSRCTMTRCAICASCAHACFAHHATVCSNWPWQLTVFGKQKKLCLAIRTCEPFTRDSRREGERHREGRLQARVLHMRT